MSVVRLDLAYDGTDFRGWARQRGDRIRTVQGVLEPALGRVLGRAPGEEGPSLAVAGRTDAGVHARGQVASFELPSQRDLERGANPARGPDLGRGVDLERLRRALNKMLAPEVVVRGMSFAPAGFHARHSATARIYTYRIDTGPAPDPFTARFVWHRVGALSVSRMRSGARLLVGEHDFTSFCRSPGQGKPTVRRLERIAIRREADRVELTFRANAFLHQMVRGLVGTLVDVGAGRIEPSAVAGILRSRDRSRAAQLAPALGLTLERVVYARR